VESEDDGDANVNGDLTGQALVARELRSHRERAGLSRTELARRAGYSRTYISNCEKPGSDLISRAVVTRIDEELGAGGVLIAAHQRAAAGRQARRGSVGNDHFDRAARPHRGRAAPPVAASADRYGDTDCSGRLVDTVRALAQLSGCEMDRRQFLAGTAFAAASFAEPALYALTDRPAERIARATGRSVAMEDVEIITESLRHLRKLDHRYGAGRVREQVVYLLNAGVSAVTDGSYSGKVGKALVGAVAQTSWLAGSMASDIGDHSLAQRYYIHTLNLAVRGGDRQYAANVLSHMSRLTVQISNGARSDEERLRHARQATSLARAGRMIVGREATPVMSALLDAVEARGQALAGESGEARASVLSAEKHYDRARHADEPEWLSFYSEAELAADLGRCLRDSGDAREAAQLIGHALDGYESWRMRSRCFVQTDLASAHLVGGDYDQAAVLGHEAIETSMQVRSSRVLERIHSLRWQFRSLAPNLPEFSELDSRIIDLVDRPDDAEGEVPIV
jgi:transcriptional regulator with XRE-family HTH domain